MTGQNGKSGNKYRDPFDFALRASLRMTAGEGARVVELLLQASA